LETSYAVPQYIVAVTANIDLHCPVMSTLPAVRHIKSYILHP